MAGFPEITSFADFSDVEKYEQYRSQVSAFINGLLDRYRPEVVIVIERKGRRLFMDFADCSHIRGMVIMTDSEFVQSDIINRRVLIFDDSMHKAKSVIMAIDSMGPARPANLIVSAILSNGVAKNNLINRGVPQENIEVFESFEEYEDQQHRYSEMMFTLLNGVKNKLGTSYPSLVMTSESDVKGISQSIRTSIEGMGFNMESIDNPINDSKGVIAFTAYAKTEEQLEWDGCPCEEIKIRFCVFDQCGVTTAVMEPILMFSDLQILVSGCQDLPMYNRLCRIMDVDPSDDICRKCMTLDSPLRYLIAFSKRLFGDLSRSNIKIEKIEVSLPKRERYPSELVRDWDVFRR